mmetsp:Transcript_55590/g.176506  ORF Transcript_55590/g.176506 Transcript_55590/m.176506 type:complete len:244 (+) Transcript_55590:278-1009(+)
MSSARCPRFTTSSDIALGSCPARHVSTTARRGQEARAGGGQVAHLVRIVQGVRPEVVDLIHVHRSGHGHNPAPAPAPPIAAPPPVVVAPLELEPYAPAPREHLPAPREHLARGPVFEAAPWAWLVIHHAVRAGRMEGGAGADHGTPIERAGGMGRYVVAVHVDRHAAIWVRRSAPRGACGVANQPPSPPLARPRAGVVVERRLQPAAAAAAPRAPVPLPPVVGGGRPQMRLRRRVYPRHEEVW